jgi:hypothetical protein
MHPVGYLKEQPLCGKPRGWSSMPGMTWPLIPVTWWRLVGGVVVVGWSLVENCTVDASILFSVVKLSRTWEAAIGLGELST